MSKDLKLVLLGGLVVAIAALLITSYQSITGADDATRDSIERLGQ